MTMGKNMGDQETIMEVGKVRLDLTHYPGRISIVTTMQWRMNFWTL